jgi:hypothetical protein
MFVQAFVASAVAGRLPGWALPQVGAGAVSSTPVLHASADPSQPLISFLSWDTEGGDRVRRNLLRSPGVHLRIRPGPEWLEATELASTAQGLADGMRYSFKLPHDGTFSWEILMVHGGLTMSFAASGSGISRLGDIELVFPFDPAVTPTTVIATEWYDDGSFASPLIISAPDFGQMLLECTPNDRIAGRLTGSQFPHTVDLSIRLPPVAAEKPVTITLKPLVHEAPAGLQDKTMWPLVRRSWFNAFQPGAAWSTEGIHFRGGIPGILANNVISDPCSISQTFYADMMLWMPQAAGNISLAQLVRRTVDYWLAKRTVSTHEAYGYHDFTNFLDANPSLLISAWDYVEATDDVAWLRKNIASLEGLAEFVALRDQDMDGLVEATQSGNAGTLWVNNRSSNWFDAVNFGHKDAYSNALIYRAWCCLADLEGRLERKPQQSRYHDLAGRLKAAYARQLLNPDTGWILCWKSDDGKLHDYASPIINGLAISYGLVEPDQGRRILDRLWEKMGTAGFHRFDLGIPFTLDPVHRSDYLQPDGFGIATREDGTDTFQMYQNGGIFAGHSVSFLLANYVVGYQQKADKVLRAMLARQQQGLFQNGVQGTYLHGAEWRTWDGSTCGYEGYLADEYYFLQAILLREAASRSRYLKPMQRG